MSDAGDAGRPMPRAPWVVQRDDIETITMCLERAMLTIKHIATREKIRRMLDEAERAKGQ